jgi:hypothetical protein
VKKMPHEKPDTKPIEPEKPGNKPDHDLPGKPDRPGAHPDHDLPEGGFNPPPKPVDPDYGKPEPPRKLGEAEPRRTEKELLLSKIQIILTAHGGLESAIPYPHEYWALGNQYRGMP